MYLAIQICPDQKCNAWTQVRDPVGFNAFIQGIYRQFTIIHIFKSLYIVKKKLLTDYHICEIIIQIGKKP
jgi:hypothetical protein